MSSTSSSSSSYVSLDPVDRSLQSLRQFIDKPNHPHISTFTPTLTGGGDSLSARSTSAARGGGASSARSGSVSGFGRTGYGATTQSALKATVHGVGGSFSARYVVRDDALHRADAAADGLGVRGASNRSRCV